VSLAAPPVPIFAVMNINESYLSMTYYLTFAMDACLSCPAGCVRTYMTDVGSRKINGFSLLDLMLTLVITSLLAALAVPAYNGFIDKGKNAKAIGDIGSISIDIESFRLRNNDLIPINLNELLAEVPLDPWGNPYSYLNIKAAGPGAGGLRKDGKLNPLNTDFDLFSMGSDGDSEDPLSAKASRDDIVRANNGDFIGLGEDY